MTIEHPRDKALMVYDISYYKDARAKLDRLSPDVARRILSKIERMRHDLAGDVKRLKEFVPNYRLRVGDWRVLFEVKAGSIIIHDIKHRSQAYDG
jgi:mRNA interferase RelE/StbE